MKKLFFSSLRGMASLLTLGLLLTDTVQVSASAATVKGSAFIPLSQFGILLHQAQSSGYLQGYSQATPGVSCSTDFVMTEIFGPGNYFYFRTEMGNFAMGTIEYEFPSGRPIVRFNLGGGPFGSFLTVTNATDNSTREGEYIIYSNCY